MFLSTDHWEEGAHAEALGGSGTTSTELFALLHLPPWVGTHVSMHLHPVPQTETLFYNSEPGSRLSQKAVRASAHRGGGTAELGGALESKREAGDGSTVTWRGRKVHGVRRQGVRLYHNKEQV